MKKILLSLFVIVSFSIQAKNADSLAQEKVNSEAIKKAAFQADVNVGYSHWISYGYFNNRAYNKGLVKFPVSFQVNLQKNLKSNHALTLGLFMINAQEENPISGSEVVLGRHVSASAELGFKFYLETNKTSLFIQPQLGFAMYQFPELSGTYTFGPRFERTKATSYGVAASLRIGAEFKVSDNWYVQPVAALSFLNTSLGGEHTYTEFYPNSNKVETWISTNEYLLLNFSVGIGRYFGKK